MIKIAIVGNSKLEPDEQRRIVKAIDITLKYLKDNYHSIEIVSGGADGVDTLAIIKAKEYGFRVKKIKPDVQDWNKRGGFKDRNLEIVEYCDKVLCFTPKIEQGDKQQCYHCMQLHKKTAGCWTLKQAWEVGKKGERIIV